MSYSSEIFRQQEQQAAQAVLVPAIEKSVGVAVFLAFLFGPLGWFYVAGDWAILTAFAEFLIVGVTLIGAPPLGALLGLVALGVTVGVAISRTERNNRSVPRR